MGKTTTLDFIVSYISKQKLNVKKFRFCYITFNVITNHSSAANAY